MKTQPTSNPIRTARKKAKLTQQALGKLVGVNKPAVSCWEAGRYRPDPNRALKLVEVLPGLTMAAIYAIKTKAA